MSIDLRTFMNNASEVVNNPSGFYQATMRTLIEQRNGELNDISAGNPMVMTVESFCALTNMFIESDRAETSKMYASMADGMRDLYSHMASIHFTQIFAQPARTTFYVLFNKAELLSKLVPVGTTGAKKLTLARNSYFTIDDFEFGIHYPIDIIQQAHGGLRIAWDLSQETTLQRVSTNVLKSRTVKRDETELLLVEVPVTQFSIISKKPTVSPASTFVHTTQLTDKYYATRVYLNTSLGPKELKVVYAEELYDAQTPTVLVRPLEDSVEVIVPQVYITTGKLVGELRIDHYVTKGPLELTFDNYPIGSIVPRWRDLNPKADTTYTAATKNLGIDAVISAEPVTGGAEAMSFDELRSAVIADAIGDPQLPVTPAQIQNNLVRSGYEIIKNADVVTERVFLASKNMPEPTDPSLLTAANASIETLNASFDDLIGRSCVYLDGERLSITPDAVYRLDDGILKMLDDSELAAVESLRSELLAAHVTENSYLYSPFYYVADKAKNRFRLSAYYLDNPGVTGLTFVSDNPTTNMQVNTDGYLLEKTDAGYRLRVSTLSNSEYQLLADSQVGVLLGFIPPNEKEMAFVKASLLQKSNGERVFGFDIETRYSIDENDQLGFWSFKLYDTSERQVFCALDAEFEIFYYATGVRGGDYEASEMDAMLPTYLLDPDTSALTHETMSMTFGTALNNLWSRGRPIAAGSTYKTYPEDVIARYEKNVYEKDENGIDKITFVDGVPTRNLLHAIGDPYLDPETNEPVVQYPAGSIMYENGEPILLEGRYLKNHMELFMIEGAYRFTTDAIALDYAKQLAQRVAYWVSEDLGEILKRTMDKTKVYFYPKTIFGMTEVLVADGIQLQIPAAQRFDVSLHVPLTVYQDEDMKKQIKNKTVLLISDYLKNQTLSSSELTEMLRQTYSGDVLDVQVSLFGPQENIALMQLVNPVHRCGIKKRLVSRDDEKLVVEEDITFSFVTL